MLASLINCCGLVYKCTELGSIGGKSYMDCGVSDKNNAGFFSNRQGVLPGPSTPPPPPPPAARPFDPPPAARPFDPPPPVIGISPLYIPPNISHKKGEITSVFSGLRMVPTSNQYTYHVVQNGVSSVAKVGKSERQQ